MNINIDKKNSFISLVLIVASLLFQFFPLQSQLFSKIRNNNLAVIEGGLELIFIVLLLYITNRFLNAKKALILSTLILMWYARIHQVLIPLFAALLFIESFIKCGSFGGRLLSIEKENHLIDYVLKFIVGIVIFSSLLLILSIFKLGSIYSISIAFVCISIFCFIVDRKNKLLIIKAKSFLLKEKNRAVKYVFYLASVFLLFLSAKSNRSVTFDGLNYGLRTEYTLFGESSFFEHLSMRPKTHYYPKLYELLNAPLNLLPDYSFVIVFTISLLGFFLFSMVAIFKKLDFNNFYALLFGSLLSTIPAFASISTSSKPDTLCIIFTIWSVIFFYLYTKGKLKYGHAYSLVCVFLSFSAKFLGLAHMPFIACSVFLMTFLMKGKNLKKAVLLPKSYFLLIWLSFFIFICFIFRTYLLTGVPMMIMSGLWTKFGLVPDFATYEIKALMPSGKHSDFFLKNLLLINSENYLSVFEYMRKCFFAPKGYLFIQTYWYGNAILFMLICLTGKLILNFRKNKSVLSILLIGIFAVNFFQYMITFFFHHIKGYGGYYLIVPIVLSLFFFFVQSKYLGWINNKIFNTILIIFLLGQIIMSFCTGGTREAIGTSAFNASLIKPIFETEETNNKIFKEIGLRKLTEYIKSNFDYPPTILNNFNPDAKRIKGKVHSFSTKQLDLPYKDFIKYLKFIKADLLLLNPNSIENKNIKRLIATHNMNVHNGEWDKSYWIDVSIFCGMKNSKKR